MTETMPRSTVTLRETDLFAAVCCALESGEFVQIRGQLEDETNGRCAFGVARTIAQRAGVPGLVIPWLIDRRAGALLGCAGVAEANDAGHSFTLIAAALRRARLDVETES